MTYDVTVIPYDHYTHAYSLIPYNFIWRTSSLATQALNICRVQATLRRVATFKWTVYCSSDVTLRQLSLLSNVRVDKCFREYCII